MKKLIYIFLFLPLLLNGQVAENKTYPFKGYAFQGDGASNYINLGSEVLNDTIWTLALRLKIIGTTNTYNALFSETSKQNLEIYNTNGIIRYRDASYSYHQIGSGYDLTDGNDYDVIIRSNGDSVIAYINGVNKGGIALNASLKIKYIFQFSTTLFQFEGNAYDVRIWKSDIGEAECLKYHTNTMNSLPYIWLPLDESNGNIAYDVMGNSNGIINGSNYWGNSSNKYNQTYGFTRVAYQGKKINIPYTIDKTPIYDHSTPVMNSNEKYINYPDTIWNKKYWVK